MRCGRGVQAGLVILELHATYPSCSLTHKREIHLQSAGKAEHVQDGDGVGSHGDKWVTSSDYLLKGWLETNKHCNL